MTTTDDARRAAAARRSEAYRERRRRRSVLAPVAVEPHTLRALEKLGLLIAGERGRVEVALAVSRYLRGAPAVVALGESLPRVDGLGS